MPTDRPRLTIAETHEVAAALDLASRRWPGTSSLHELLLRLVERGRSVIEREHQAERRRAAILRTTGALTGVYEPGDRKRLRDDWPA